jgi:hypothetical protein
MNDNQLIEKFESDIEEIWKQYVKQLEEYAYRFGQEHMKGIKEIKIVRIIDKATDSIPDLSRNLQESAVEGSKAKD